MENCLSCNDSRDWCCSKKKARGMITCVNKENMKGNGDIPLEIDGASKCSRYNKIENATR